MFFAGSDVKDTKNKIVIFLVGIGLMIAGLNFIQLDIKTSALFYDSIGMQSLMKGSAPIAGVSKEAWIAAATLSLFQVYISFRLVTAGGKKMNFWGREVNSTRFWTVLLFFVALFDTLTDVDYRSFGMKDLKLTIKVFLVSLLVYNFGSEWALGTGFREVVQGVTDGFNALRKHTSSKFVPNAPKGGEKKEDSKPKTPGFPPTPPLPQHFRPAQSGAPKQPPKFPPPG